MTIEIHSSFKKSYQKRIAPYLNLKLHTEERLRLFTQNPHHPLLKNHRLKGKKSDLRAFSITGDIRIVYCILSKDRVLLLEIGRYNQAY